MTIATDIHADLITPLGAYLRLRAGTRAAFLLESVEKGRLGRYSLVGSGSRLVTFDEAERELAAGAPVVGYLGYDHVAELEPTVAAARRRPRPAREPLRRRRDARPLRPRDERRRGAAGDPATRSPPCSSGRAPRPEAAAAPGRTRRFPARAAYEAGVRRAKEHIRAGDAFQIVLSQRAERPTDVSALALYRSLRRINPSPYHFLLELGGISLVGSSPETLVKLDGSAREREPDRRHDHARAQATPSACSPPRRTAPSTSCSSTSAATTSRGSAAPGTRARRPLPRGGALLARHAPRLRGRRRARCPAHGPSTSSAPASRPVRSPAHRRCARCRSSPSSRATAAARTRARSATRSRRVARHVHRHPDGRPGRRPRAPAGGGGARRRLGPGRRARGVPAQARRPGGGARRRRSRQMRRSREPAAPAGAP